MYIMTWEYYEGPVVMLQRSDCWGKEWSTPTNVFGADIWNAFPAMCCYVNGTQDELLIASSPDTVVKSSDSGDSFQPLTSLPMPEGCSDWRYMAVATNASWFGGEADPDIYVFGSLYVGEYWSGTYVLAFTKSTDWGRTWSEPVFVCENDGLNTNYPEVISDGSKLYVTYTQIHADLLGADLFARSSDDWGTTWSDAVPIPLDHPSGIAPTGFQALDDEKAIMTVESNGQPIDATGWIGYFYFSNMTYQALYTLNGPDWCPAYATFAGELAGDGVYHIAWAYEPVLSEPMTFKYACTENLSFDGQPLRTPLMMGNPPSGQADDGSYGCEMHGTDPDNGGVIWELKSNGSWLSEEPAEDGSCNISGKPTEVGDYWVNLTVRDDDSSDSFNWTVCVTQAVPAGDDVPAEDDEPPADDEAPADEEPPAGQGLDVSAVITLAAIASAVVIAVALVAFFRRKESSP